MKSKYSVLEIEQKLDSVEYKVDKSDVIDSPPTTLKDSFNNMNVFNSNVIIQLLTQIKDFQLQSPIKFLEFIDKIPNTNLLTDNQYSQLEAMSSSFVGVFVSIKDVPDIFRNGSIALIQFGIFNKPDFIFKNNNKWYWLNGTSIKYDIVKDDMILVGPDVISEYKLSEVYIYATHPDKTTQVIKLNLIKDKDEWWLQINKNTLINPEIPMISISLNKSLDVNPYPELYITALEDCEVSVQLNTIV